MTAALFRRRLEEAGIASAWRVESAGTWACEGAPAARKAQMVMQEWGLDLSSHRSQCIKPERLYSFDLILVMSNWHREALRVEFPEIADRVCLLAEMAGLRDDVPDPIDGSLADVCAVARDIHMFVARGFNQIVQRAGGQRRAEG